MWLKKSRYRIVGFHTPRYWYVDNTNLEMCGLKIKYANIFPVKITLSNESTIKAETNNIRGDLTDGDILFEGFHGNEDDDDEEEDEYSEDGRNLIVFNRKDSWKKYIDTKISLLPLTRLTLQ